MATVLVRDLDETTVECLRDRAKANGRSLEAELRIVLRNAASAPARAMTLEEVRERARRMRESFGDKIFTDTADLIREDRDSR